MFGFGKSPETALNPELTGLPKNPSEYAGQFFEKTESKTDMDRALELLQIRNLAEQGK